MITVNVVEASTPEVFNHFLYPEQHPGVYDYIKTQFNNISSTITESGLEMINQSKRMMAEFYDNTVERIAKAAVRMARNMGNPNSICQFNSLEDIQMAAPLMQRYIMTDPFIREKYHQQLCSGYSGTYVDIEPGKIKQEHYDWRRVNSGIIQDIDNDGIYDWKSTTHFEDLRDGDVDLSFDQKLDVISSIELARLFAEQGEDPTCPWGNKIG